MDEHSFQFVPPRSAAGSRPVAADAPHPASRLYLDPRTVTDLLTDKSFFRVLSAGLVFIQDRRASSERLLNAMELRAESDGIRIRREHAREVEYPDLCIELSVKHRRARQRKSIVILDAAGASSELPSLIESVSSAYPHRTAMWVRAHVREVPPHCLQLFDAVFLFDMALHDLEAARTTIPMSSRHVRGLRDQSSARPHGSSERVLVYLARDAERDPQLPLLLDNPSLVTMRPDERWSQVSVDSFVPVIVEAVKFVFDRVGKRLDRGEQSSVESDEISLPIHPGEFDAFAQAPRKYLVETLEYQSATMVEGELRSLMTRIARRQNLINRRAEKAELAGADEQSKLELQNEYDEERQVRDWRRLSELLNQVFADTPASP